MTFDSIVACPALIGFTARFNAAIGPISFGVPADGISFAVGNLGAGPWGEFGPGTPNSLAVGFGTYANGPASPPTRPIPIPTARPSRSRSATTS